MEKYIDIQAVNDSITKDVVALINKNEKTFANQVSKLAKELIKNQSKMVLISGPSCAGKTTFAKLLTQHLQNKNYKVVNIEMDNFFIDRAKRKRLKNGEEDLDSIRIVNKKQLKHTIATLFKKGEAVFPYYDFKKCVNVKQGETLKFDQNTIIIFEGIHVLNPAIYNLIDTQNVYKVFITNKNPYKLGEQTLSTREVRFVRRMVRDKEKRNTSPLELIKLWHNIVSAEEEYILPFATNADMTINSSYEFELGLYQDDLKQIAKDFSIVFENNTNLLLARKMKRISKKQLCPTSLMWEYIKK